MANLIAIPANHADQMFLNHKFFKQYDRLMEYIHTVLIIKQPEIYIDTIFYNNGAQIELTWRHVDTQHMCYGTINIHNTIDLPKMVTHCKRYLILLWLSLVSLGLTHMHICLYKYN